jgi:hypothetical protein
MSEQPKTRRRWYQFTIKRILWATFWMAICFAAAIRHHSGKGPDDLSGFIASVAVIALSPFVAAGSLFGRPFVGLLVGIILVGGYVLAVYIAIENGWIGWP